MHQGAVRTKVDDACPQVAASAFVIEGTRVEFPLREAVLVSHPAPAQITDESVGDVGQYRLA
ncbi:MAG: hypothetical protein R3B07_12350, partial [Polyangiaceae bacterium]